MPLSFLPNNAFPLPAPLAPKLIALGLDNKTAEKVSKVYLSSAFSLKETCETEYIRACDAFVATSDSRGYSSKELRSRLLTLINSRYMQALSKCLDESIEKAEAFLRKNITSIPRPKVINTTLCKLPEKVGADTPKSSQFSTISPPHAFPQTYPPLVRPEQASFATSIPPVGKSEGGTRSTSNFDLDACIAAFARLSLGPSQLSEASEKPMKTIPKPRTRTNATPKFKPTSRLSPTAPRLVSPKLDISVAVSHKSLPKNAPLRAILTSAPRTQNIDIPRSSRRRACSIPYRRPTTHPPTPQESSPSSHFSSCIRRTPSLVSDYGSEASSPSTPPDLPSALIPIPSTTHKDTSPESTSLLEQFLVPYPEYGWQDIDFGTDIYG